MSQSLGFKFLRRAAVEGTCISCLTAGLHRFKACHLDTSPFGAGGLSSRFGSAQRLLL